jgi:hypothetical protein
MMRNRISTSLADYRNPTPMVSGVIGVDDSSAFENAYPSTETDTSG